MLACRFWTIKCLSPPFNYTYIVLIPKKRNPRGAADFIPISLCNVIYKIIAKVITNRLKFVLPRIVSIAQSTFVPRRLISNNILISQQCLHHIMNKHQGKTGLAPLKLDMSTTYDRVELRFLGRILLKMGFQEEWVNQIIDCVSTVRYSVLINRNVSQCFMPQSGLRQGDPIFSLPLYSLCWVFICVDYLWRARR